MALPSSGSISLNQMHIEVGSSSGTQVSINDSDIRGLIGKSSGATMSFSEWYGASAFTADTQVDFTPATAAGKYSGPQVATYSMLFIAQGTIHNNDIEYTQNTKHYIHLTSASTLALSPVTSSIHFNNSTSPTAGTGTASYFNNKYWRVPSTYNNGTSNNSSGNYLINGGTSHTVVNTQTNTTVFQGFIATINGTSLPLGQANLRLQIQIY